MCHPRSQALCQAPGLLSPVNGTGCRGAALTGFVGTWEEAGREGQRTRGKVKPSQSPRQLL